MIPHPFDRSMFESYAREGMDTLFIMVIAGGFLLVGILYFIRAYLRNRKGGLDLDDVPAKDLSAIHQSLFDKVKAWVAKKRSARWMALSRLAEFDPPTVNCTLIRTKEGQDENIGRATIFHLDGGIFLEEQGFFITTPDGIKAEERSSFSEGGAIMNLWFLHDRIPYTVNCEIVERTRFPAEILRNMDPKVGVGYRLIPISRVVKQDKRQALRFSHKVGQGRLRVYPQVTFDVYVQKTDFRFPTRGSIPPRINFLTIPLEKTGEEDPADVVPERIVERFKKAVRMNHHTEDRVVHVSKSYLDERTNRRTLVEFGFSEVLGLNAKEAGRTIHIKKPFKTVTIKRRGKDPHRLKEGDELLLDFRSPVHGVDELYDIVCLIVKVGIENLSLQPIRPIRTEENLPLEILDFSLNGFRFENNPEFMRYVIEGEDRTTAPSRQKEVLENTGFVFTFYPRLRFSRDIQVYKPDLPLKFSILGKIVRCEQQAESDKGMKAFGVRFMYDPVEFGIDDYRWNRWGMIRPLSENQYFREVHKSLNALIAHLESQSKEFLGLRRFQQGSEKETPVERKIAV